MTYYLICKKTTSTTYHIDIIFYSKTLAFRQRNFSMCRSLKDRCCKRKIFSRLTNDDDDDVGVYELIREIVMGFDHNKVRGRRKTSIQKTS